MIIWFILFFIILFISLVLAYLSMKDYQEIPKLEKEYSTYLIRKPDFLTTQTLSNILDLNRGKLIALERLFKGKSNALVIFGPKILKERFSDLLGLLELEDYTGERNLFTAWEVIKKEEIKNSIFAKFPAILENEKFYWQVLISGDSGQIRAAYSGRNELIPELETFAQPGLTKIPRPMSSSQIFNLYKQRVFTPANAQKISVTEALLLIGLPRI